MLRLLLLLLRNPIILVLIAVAIWWWWRRHRAAARASLTCPRCGARGQIQQHATGSHWVSRCRVCGFERRLSFRV
ncbi:MAG: hypothetical protein HY320_00855 [Armatimonadetes bacterium]|nr:hypothetical protein [Armatimonadota bacterium]